jgi:hypothetical protein
MTEKRKASRRRMPTATKGNPPAGKRGRDRRAGGFRAVELGLGDRVEVTITVASQSGAVPRPAFGRIVALDQVAVVVEGEIDARAFEPSKVKRA